MFSLAITMLYSLSKFEKSQAVNTGVTVNVTNIADNTIEANLTEPIDTSARPVYEVSQCKIKNWTFVFGLTLMSLLFLFNDLSFVSFALSTLVLWLFVANSLNLVISRVNMDDLDTELRGANGKKMVLGMSWFMLANMIKSIIE